MSERPTKVRTRFPPSPTGALHLGGARTALFNWLFARHHGGQFILRMEDTDRARSKQEYVVSILEGLRWLGLDWDEGPYFQSQRLARYREVIDRMLAEGKAYWCHCSPERLKQMRERARAEGRKPMYDGTCRDKGLGPAPGAVVRFRGPRAGATTFNDVVHGPITFQHAELDDLVLLRSDSTPTYHLAVVVDDIDMGITHVIRGDDHLPNTPRQILLYQALGEPTPVYAHVPMILGPDRTKLSKRHGAASVTEYRDMGYLADALVNALARLGWSHGDQEIFTRQELIEYFTLEGVNASPAVFDQDKLLRLNQRYIQKTPVETLADLLPPFLARIGIEAPDRQMLLKCLPELVTRAKTLVELADGAMPFLVEMPPIDPKAARKFLTPETAGLLKEVLELVRKVGVSDVQALDKAFREMAEAKGLKLVAVAQPTRVALVGRTYSPGLFEVMNILGQQKVEARITRAIAVAEGREPLEGR